MTKSYEELSRLNWRGQGDEWPGVERVSLGCLQRIATATEAMAYNYRELIDDRNYHKRSHEDLASECAALERKNAALRGVITKLKKERS